MRVGILGATGAVGQEMWKLLQEAPFPVEHLQAFTTERSAGRILSFQDRDISCETISESRAAGLDLVLASAGSGTTKIWAPKLAELGATVVDNSSAFRGDEACPLVVPEVNGDALDPNHRIIANPNCSTIQMVVALGPLHQEWGLDHVHVATYQSVSGAGAKAMTELTEATRKVLADEDPPAEVFPHSIAFNALPHIGDFDEEGESTEEKKMRDETRRIMSLPNLKVSATCVRVPVYRGHSEAVWVSFRETPDPVQARKLLSEAGVTVIDGPGENQYPLATHAAGKPDVFVGRVRRDPSNPKGLSLWVVSDNLLKGAATNAFQIACHLYEKGWLPADRA